MNIPFRDFLWCAPCSCSSHVREDVYCLCHFNTYAYGWHMCGVCLGKFTILCISFPLEKLWFGIQNFWRNKDCTWGVVIDGVWQNLDSPGIPGLGSHLCRIILMLLVGVRRSFITVGAAISCVLGCVKWRPPTEHKRAHNPCSLLTMNIWEQLLQAPAALTSPTWTELK